MSAIEIYQEVLSGKRTRFPRNFFKSGNIINYDAANQLIKYLIEDILKYNDEQIKNNISMKFFLKYGLKNMIDTVFNGDPFKAINSIYPNKYHVWEFKYPLINYWNLGTAKEATIWLFEEKLKWNDEQIKANLSAKVFSDNGLIGMLDTVFSGSPVKAINNAYPGKFRVWEFNSVPNNYWNLETAKDATIWLFEEKLKWDDEKIKNNISITIFRENGLGGMLYTLFNNNYFKAIVNAYDKKFKAEDFSKHQYMATVQINF